jgi:APA family basic amino acid/polyamine antiporter
MGITLVLVLIVGTQAGRAFLNAVLQAAGVKALAWEGHGGFDTLLRCSSPMFWLFFLLTGVSLFFLRAKDRGLNRPFSVPLYPVVPLVFCGMCAYMLYSATIYAGWLTLLGVAPVLLGVVVLAFCRPIGKQEPKIAPEP